MVMQARILKTGKLAAIKMINMEDGRYEKTWLSRQPRIFVSCRPILAAVRRPDQYLVYALGEEFSDVENEIAMLEDCNHVGSHKKGYAPTSAHPLACTHRKILWHTTALLSRTKRCGSAWSFVPEDLSATCTTVSS